MPSMSRKIVKQAGVRKWQIGEHEEVTFQEVTFTQFQPPTNAF